MGEGVLVELQPCRVADYFENEAEDHGDSKAPGAIEEAEGHLDCKEEGEDG